MSSQSSSLTRSKAGIIGKRNITPQVKSKNQVILRDRPSFGQRGLHLHIAVDLNQCIVKLVYCPHHLFVLGKGRVKGGQPAAFVVAEYLFIWMLMRSAGEQEDGEKDTGCKMPDTGYKIQDAGCSIRGAKSLILQPVSRILVFIF